MATWRGRDNSEGIRILSYRPQGEVYMFSAFLGAYVLVVNAIILLIINRTLIEEDCYACASCGGRGQREAYVKDVNIDPVVVLLHK